MDMTDLRGIATVLCALAFAAVVWWAYGPSRKKRFEEDAKMPFAEDDDVDGKDSSIKRVEDSLTVEDSTDNQEERK